MLWKKKKNQNSSSNINKVDLGFLVSFLLPFDFYFIIYFLGEFEINLIYFK